MLWTFLLSATLWLQQTYGAVPVQANNNILKWSKLPQTQTFTDNKQLEIRSSQESVIALAEGDRTFTLFELTAPTVVISNVTFSDGFSSANGGCILINGCSELHVINTQFIRCGATQSGGGIFIHPFEKLVITLQSSNFQEMSSIATYSAAHQSKMAASGAAVGALLSEKSDRSVIWIENVVVQNIQQHLILMDSKDPLPIFGSVFLFVWNESFSGNGVQAQVRGLDLLNVSTTWEVFGGLRLSVPMNTSALVFGLRVRVSNALSQ